MTKEQQKILQDKLIEYVKMFSEQALQYLNFEFGGEPPRLYNIRSEFFESLNTKEEKEYIQILLQEALKEN